MTLPRSSKTARLKQLNAFFRRIGRLPAKRKKESRRQQLSSPSRLYSVMHKKSKQDNDWEGDTQ